MKITADTKWEVVSYRGGVVKGLWSWQVRQKGLTKVQAVEAVHRMKAFSKKPDTHWMICPEGFKLKRYFESK